MRQTRAEGYYPSISIEESVTRVGRQAQWTLQKQTTLHAQKLLGEYRSQQEYAKFSADLSDKAKAVLRQGAILETLLEQIPYQTRQLTSQVIVIALMFTDFFAKSTLKEVTRLREALLTELDTNEALADLHELAPQPDIT